MQKIAAQPVVYVRKGVRRGGARVYNSRAAEINCLAIQRRARLENQAKSWAGQRKLLLPIQASSLQLYLRVFGEQKFEPSFRETNAATPAQPGMTEDSRGTRGTTTDPQLQLRGYTPIVTCRPRGPSPRRARSPLSLAEVDNCAETRGRARTATAGVDTSRNGGKFAESSMSLRASALEQKN